MTSMEWRVCPRFPTYEVSECGDLRRRSDREGVNQPGRRLRGFIDIDGYLRYPVRSEEGEKFTVGAHQMVAEAFIGPTPSLAHQVAHANGSRLLNTPSNLRWALPVENQADRKTHGTGHEGEGNGRATITEDDVRFIRRRYREIKANRGRIADLDEQFNLSRCQIIRIVRGQAWSHVS
jgi:hypothetical protein